MRTHRPSAGSACHLRVLVSLLVSAAALGTALPAHAQDEGESDDGAMITCTVRIEHKDMLAESFAEGLTVEEAEDGALEGACALRCVTAAEEASESDGAAPHKEGDEGAGTAPAHSGSPTAAGASQSGKGEAKASGEAREAAATEDDAQARGDDDGDEPSDNDAAEDDPDGVEACIEECTESAILIGTLCTDAASETVFAEGAFDPDDARPKAPGDADDEGEDDGGNAEETKGVAPAPKETGTLEAPTRHPDATKK